MLTYWPRFSISRNDLGNQAEIKDISTLRMAPSTEFRGGSCGGSQIGWGPIFAKFCHDALQLILRHPQMYILQFCTGGFGNSVEKRY